MSEKDAILLLCNTINKLFDENLMSFHLRSAKQNKDDDSCILVLWQILHHFVCQDKCICHTEGRVICVKVGLIRLGFEDLFFLALPDDTSVGSRDLLLALGWIIGINCIETEIDKIVARSTYSQEFLNQNENNEDAIVKELYSKNAAEELSPSNYINLIMYTAGRLNKEMHMLRDLECERDSIMNKVHEQTSDVVGVPHFSVLESSVIAEPHLLPFYLESMSSVLDLVDSYMLWAKHKSKFFDWMDSVIEDHHEDRSRNILTEKQISTLSQLTSVLMIRAQEGCKDTVLNAVQSNSELLSPTDGKSVQDMNMDEQLLTLSIELEKLSIIIT